MVISLGLAIPFVIGILLLVGSILVAVWALYGGVVAKAILALAIAHVVAVVYLVQARRPAAPAAWHMLQDAPAQGVRRICRRRRRRQGRAGALSMC